MSAEALAPDKMGMMDHRGYVAEVLLDSVNTSGVRLTTFRLRYPTYVHQDLLRHRILSMGDAEVATWVTSDHERSLSRSVASNRAIPVQRYLEQLQADPVYPLRWGKNQAGMQANEENLDGEHLAACQEWWDD